MMINDACPPPRKKEKLDADVDFWASWDNVHADYQQTQQADVLSFTDLAEVELAKYVAAPCQQRASDPLTWWHDNAARFPLLSAAARRYLATLQRACLVSVSSAPLATLLMTS